MSIFKNTFIPEVQAQLTVRQNALVNRTPQLIATLNASNAFIRMTSSVNVNGTNTLAKQYILQGGILDSTGKPRFGVGGQDSAYSNQSPSGVTYNLGIRPMPGITDISVETKTAYGSLREVKVNFIAWDIHQLEDLEVLYMRPGYSVLIEFGRVPYIDNKGNTQTNIQYYDIINTIKPKEQIWKDLFQKTKDLSGNYDAVFGFVKNYGWENRPDGGYNCFTSIISIGEILESLKVNYSPFSTTNIISQGVTGLLNDPNLQDHYTKNILAGLFYEFQQAASKKLKSVKLSTYADGGPYTFKDTNNNNIIYDFFIKSLKLNNDNTKDDTKIGHGDEQVYVRLGSLVDILNKYVLLSDIKSGTPLVKLSVKDRDYDLSPIPSPNNSLLCLAYPLQLSCDPTICLIKNSFWVNARFNISPQTSTSNNIVKFSNKDYSKLIQFLFDEILGSNPENINIAEIKQQIISNVGSNYYDTKEFSRQFWLYRKQYHISTADEIKQKYGYTDATIATKYQANKLGTSVSSNFDSSAPVADLFIDNNIFDNTTILQAFPGDNPSAIPSSEQTATDGSSSLSAENGGGSVVNNTTYNDLLFGIDPTEYENDKIKANQALLNQTSSKNLSFLNKLQPYFLGDNYQNELGIIENYYINLQFLYSLSINQNLTNNDKKEKNDLQLYDFIKNILQGMQNATGNVNNFDLFVDPIDNNIARIIDVNYVDQTKRIDAYNNTFIVELQGLKTTARSYDLKSQIFPEQSTIIAVSAQAGGGQLGTENNTMIAFHKNLTDRIIPVRDSPTVNNTQPQQPQQQIATLNLSLSKLYQYFGDLSTGFFRNSQFDLSKVNDYENSLKDIIAFFKGLTVSDSKNRNIIPTKLSIDLDGIGGLVIGHLFRIPLNLLPKGYKGDEIGSKIAHIITGINHKITNDWITSLESQIIILDEPVGETNLFDIIFTDPATNTNNINLNYNSQGTVVSNKPTPSDYQTKYDAAIVNPSKISTIDAIVNRIVANKARYTNISALVNNNVPWYIIGIIHYNECNLSFSHHLHNGDPLTARTIRVPAGRIPNLNPPYTFEQSATDALLITGFTTKNLSSIPYQLQALEAYNGFGYANKGVNSPYVWSFTNQYTSGKYIKAGVYSSTAVSDQTGAAAILKRMQAKGVI